MRRELAGLLVLGLALWANCQRTAAPSPVTSGKALEVTLNNVTATRMPRPQPGGFVDPGEVGKGRDWFQVCWDPPKKIEDLAGVVVFRGSPGSVRREQFARVEQVALQQRCWRGADSGWTLRWKSEDDRWAVAAVALDGREGNLNLALTTPARWLGPMPVSGLGSDDVRDRKSVV